MDGEVRLFKRKRSSIWQVVFMMDGRQVSVSAKKLPFSIYADTVGTGQVSEKQIDKAVSGCMDLTPRGIRTHLGLNKPIYQRTAAYGHFDRAPDVDGGFSWERTDLIDALKAVV